MILCNRKPHPNRLNEFADEIKSTRRKQIFSLVNAYERKKIEFSSRCMPFLLVCPLYWLFQAHSRLNMKSSFWIEKQTRQILCEIKQENKHKMNMYHIEFRWKEKKMKGKHGAKKSRIKCVKFNMYAPICAVSILNNEASEEKIHSSTWFVRLQPWRNPLIW